MAAASVSRSRRENAISCSSSGRPLAASAPSPSSVTSAVSRCSTPLELPADEVARGLGLGPQLAIHRRARHERGADGRERHDQGERERERDQRLRAQGQ